MRRRFALLPAGAGFAPSADAPFDVHLQWFAAEDEGRTEEPSEHKLRKAREEGKVAKSRRGDLLAAPARRDGHAGAAVHAYHACCHRDAHLLPLARGQPERFRGCHRPGRS